MPPRQIGRFSPEEVQAILDEQNAQDRWTWTLDYILLMTAMAKETPREPLPPEWGQFGADPSQ